MPTLTDCTCSILDTLLQTLANAHAQALGIYATAQAAARKHAELALPDIRQAEALWLQPAALNRGALNLAPQPIGPCGEIVLDCLVDTRPIIELLRAELPALQAIYLFGSERRQDSNAKSDVDVAVLLPRPLDPVRRFDVQERIAAAIGRDLDLVDVRSATTVMQAQVLRDGEMIFEAAPAERRQFEMFVLSSYARLNEERAGILRDVALRGSIHGR